MTLTHQTTLTRYLIEQRGGGSRAPAATSMR